MNIFYYNPDTGIYVEQGVADESPLEPGVWHVPAYATSDVPPSVSENEQAVYVNNGWQVQAISETETEPEPEPQVSEPAAEPELPSMDVIRRYTFAAESDPLFFKAQRGEATMDEWRAKVAEIKARYPDPT